MNDIETIPCETCGTPTRFMGTKRCNRCWEIERNLAEYLKSAGGRAFALSLMPPPALLSNPRKVYVLTYREAIITIFGDKVAAHAEAVRICTTAAGRQTFLESRGLLQTTNLDAQDFTVTAFKLADGFPVLDDWTDDGPDSWDYEAVLRDSEVTVAWGDKLVDGEGNVSECPPGLCGWDMSWNQGCIYIGHTTEIIARKAAALFVSLWLRGVSASFADKLMDGYIVFLERQESTSLTFLAEVDSYPDARPFFRLTREGTLPLQRDAFTNVEWRIIDALAPAADEEIIVTFTKRKKHEVPQVPR
jgi:hypothetical protein